jgi:hypothetical protein
MFIKDDFKYITIGIKRYHLYCDKCGNSRGYGMKSRSAMLCKKCAHRGNDYLKDKRDAVYRLVMSKCKIGQVPWNKGRSKYTKEQLQLRTNLSSAIRIRLNNRYSRKGESYLKKLGYTLQELKQHLEDQFQPGMSWDNYGKHGWHIDHRIPDSWFNYSSIHDEDFKKSWALSNLQPKWAKDNLSKGARYSD